MTEVSIIINGVRYDAVEITEEDVEFCDNCDLHGYCCEVSKATQGASFTICALELGDSRIFKKSDKKFEK